MGKQLSHNCGIVVSAETHQMIQKVSGNEFLSRSIIYKWFERFKEGREDLNDDEHSGWPRSAMNDEDVGMVCDLKKRAEIIVALQKNRIEYVQRFNLSHFTWHLEPKKVFARLDPHKLTND